MSDTIDLICFNCKHYRGESGGCDAFPDGIDDEVLRTNNHDEPLPDQENDIVYEPITDLDDDD